MKKWIMALWIVSVVAPVHAFEIKIVHPIKFMEGKEINIQNEFLNVGYQYVFPLASHSFNNLNGLRLLDHVVFNLSAGYSWEIEVDGVEELIGSTGDNSLGGTLVSANARIVGPGFDPVPYNGVLHRLVEDGDNPETPAIRSSGPISDVIRLDSMATRSFVNLEQYIGTGRQDLDLTFNGQITLGVSPTISNRPFVNEATISIEFDQKLIFAGGTLTYIFEDFGLVEHPEPFHIRMRTGSPTSISQKVSVPDEPFEISFDYQFETNFGELSVVLGGTEIGTITAPDTLEDGGFETASFLVDSSLGATDIDLSFTFDGSDGSSILIDNILFPSIINGGFQFGDAGWVANFSGDGIVEAVAFVGFNVPEPSVFMLLGVGLLGLASMRCRMA